MSIRQKTYGFVAVLIILGMGAYFGVPYFSSPVSSADSGAGGEAEEQKVEEEVPVELAIAARGAISSSITSTANLKPKREVEIAAEKEGVVRELLVEEGDFVRRGEVLLRLDDTQFKIALQTAKEQLAQAKLQLEKADILQEKSRVQVRNTREELERYQSLYEEQLVSEREVAEVKYRMDELEHDLRVSSSEARELHHRVDELKAEIEQARLEIQRTAVRAPFSGVIADRSVELGARVRSADNLFRLGDFSPLLAEVFLSEREAIQIAPGQEATVFSGVDARSEAPGRVSRISPVVDQDTGTVKVTVELARAAEAFKPGAFVRVAIRTDTKDDSVLIPKRALVEEDGEQFVFVARDRTVDRVPVRVGYEDQGRIEVLDGVTPGDSVVVAGQGGLKNGSKIRLVESTLSA